MRLKRKTDDLEKLDGISIPFWLKALVFIISFVITVAVFILLGNIIHV